MFDFIRRPSVLTSFRKRERRESGADGQTDGQTNRNIRQTKYQKNKTEVDVVHNNHETERLYEARPNSTTRQSRIATVLL